MDRRSFVQGIAGTPLALGTAAAAAQSATPLDPYAAFLGVIRAWKRRDIEAVLAALAEDIVWYPRVGGAPMRGKTAVRAALEGLASKRQADHWRIHHHAVNGERLFVEGVDDYLDQQGRRIAVPYAGIVEYRAGLIAGWRDYFDIGTLERIKAGEPIPQAIEALVSRGGEP